MEKKVCGCEGGCSCGVMHGMGVCHYHGKNHLIKIILKLVIVMLIFGFGFKLGEISGSIRGFHGGRGMMDRDGGYRMMQGYGNLDNTLDIGVKAMPPSAQTTPAPVKQ